jgi:hypothetical protein
VCGTRKDVLFFTIFTILLCRCVHEVSSLFHSWLLFHFFFFLSFRLGIVFVIPCACIILRTVLRCCTRASCLQMKIENISALRLNDHCCSGHSIGRTIRKIIPIYRMFCRIKINFIENWESHVKQFRFQIFYR